MQWSDHYRRYARYNAWINQALLNTSLSLPESEINQDRGVLFSSLNGCWNHIIAGDLLWLNRLRYIFPILDDALEQWPVPSGTHDVLFSSLKTLATERQALDKLIINWCDLLRESDSAAVLDYHDEHETKQVFPLPHILQHLFNHQTHHRGQITALLTQAGAAYDPIDFLYMQDDD